MSRRVKITTETVHRVHVDNDDLYDRSFPTTDAAEEYRLWLEFALEIADDVSAFIDNEPWRDFDPPARKVKQ